MSDTEEQKSCQTCSDFEPQTWRKSLCKNCFHTLDEHSADILANEATAVAKEKAEAKTSEKATAASSVQTAGKANAKKVDDSSAPEGIVATGRDATRKTEDKESDSATVKRKYGAARCAGDKDSAWSWAKDLGREFSKSAKPDPQDTSKGAKGSATVPSTCATGSAKSSPPTTAKPSVKSTTASTTVATPETPSPALSSSSATTTTSAVTTDTTTASVSKAKNFASKFESKAAALSSSKSTSKPKDIRPGSASVAALTGKLTDTAPGSKTKARLPPEKVDEPQQLHKKPGTKLPEDVKNTETLPKLQKTDSAKAKDEVCVESNKDSKLSNDNSKNKLSEKTPFSAGSHSKSSPFGKDILKSTKDPLKRDNIPMESVDKKTVSPQAKHEDTRKDTDKSHNAKSVSEKFSDNKMKRHDSELATTSTTNTDISQNSRTNVNNTTVSSLSATADSKLAAGGTVNNRQLAKITGSSAEGKQLENSETKDYIDATKDSGGDACESRSNKVERNVFQSEPNIVDTESVETKGITEDDKKNQSSTSVSSTSTGETPPSSTSVALTPTNATASAVDSTSSSLTSQSKTTEANKSQDILQLDSLKDSTCVQSSPGRTKDLDEENNENNEQISSLTFAKSAASSPSQPELENNVGTSNKQKTNARDRDEDTKDDIKKLNEQLKEKDEALSALNKQVSKMEEQVKMLEEERDRLQKESLQAQKDDMEILLKDLRSQLSKMEEQCTRLDKDNQALIDKLHLQEASVKRDQESKGKNSENVVLEEDLEAAEQELEEFKEENKELQRHIMEMKNEMDEMYDNFREHDHDEFREIQKELDMTAKNCRILQFKLRKAERRNDQIEQDRIQYEEKLRSLQDQFDSQDAKDHIRLLEEELRMAKEVSVRLHDELDVVEDKRNKALEENKHLTELLEHTDKRQFRLEMEIDKLRDIVSDLKQQLKEAKAGNNNNNKDSTPDRKQPPLGAIGKQGSREYDVSQLMKDLYDSMERENDLKDQLKFSEEEAKMMRRRVSEMDEENENLRLQLQKMSEKATKHKKKEKERIKELVEERSKSDAIRAALSAQNSQDDDRGEIADVILIIGPEGSDFMSSDEPIPVSQRKDSTDEDLMNVMQMRVHLEMLEQELMTSHKKLDEMDLENENLQAEAKFLQERLAEKEVNSGLPEPSTPNAYYEDKLKEMTQEADDLRWKLIEKDREIERLTAVHTRHSREHAHKKCEKLKKSKSLEETDIVQGDPRKQLEHAQMEIARLKRTVEELTQVNEDLRAENEEYKNRTPVPSVHADDAAVENIELKENLRRLEETNRGQAEKIKTLSDSLQKLTRDTRSYTSIATSPTVPGTLSIPGIPLVGPGTQTARAGVELSNPTDDSNTRDLRAQLHVLQRENEELRRSMEELGVSGEESRDSTVAGKICDSKRKPAPISPVLRDSKTQREKESRTSSTEAEVVSGNIEKTVCDKQTELNAGGIQLANQVTVPSAFDSSQPNMEYKKDSTKSTPSKASTASTKDGGGKTKDTEEEDKDRVTTSAAQDVAKVSKEVTKEEPLKSISLDYPEGKSKVIISGSESRVELMEKVLEMDEEISDLIAIVRRREDESDRLKREVKYLNSQLRELREESRRMELDLLQELDMLHDKNSVMSNLLDIINERAEAAEEELERRMQDETTHSPVRSTSNVSQVSALSDTSMGSDEVFLNAQFSKEGVITRDWESKLKVRIESLERLLAEERQKVSMAEKKLMLAGIDSVSPSVSDDVKLRLREKELLQEELLKSQRHLHIATDQIQGLKERIHILEDEHVRLKKDYARLYEEIDKPLEKEHEVSTETSSDSSDKKVTSTGLETNGTGKELCKLEAELQKYKQRATELEYKVEEIDDIWRSKSAASDKERNELEQQLNQKVKENHVLEQTLNNLKTELCARDKIIAEIDTALRDKSSELFRIAETMKDREGEHKKHEQEQQNMLAQISQRDVTIRSLNDTIRIRDERLREKDDILFKLNTSIEEHKREMTALTEKLNLMAGQLKDNDAEISVLRGQLSSASAPGRDVPRSCQTDAEKEGFRLKETVKKLQRELDKVMGDKRSLESSLEKSRKSLEEAMMMWDKDRHSLQKDANILEEKVRMYEAFNTMNRDETIETLKNEAQGYFSEKEALLCELSSEKLKHEADERAHKEQQAKLQTELTEKLRLLKTEVDSNSHMTTEMNRLKRQAEMAYRLQQEQRVFKAEHLAMKVRYETRIDKMSKEHNKMLLTIDKLQKERDIDKQIIDGIQKNFNLVKDSYTEELLRSQEDKSALRRYVKEIEESRIHLEELQRHVRDLRDKTVDQDRLRADLINKFATDRSSWEIERANLNSMVNQLDEKIFSSSRQQERSKDIQVNMGMAWEKERREQRRLLAEAHTLALDLQEQLRSRDEAFAHERKELLHQMENDRINLTKDKREIERKMMEFESVGRKVIALEKRLSDVQDKHEKDLEAWQKERGDLLRAAAEARHAQARDCKMLENILSKLIRLRELGTMLTSQHKWDSLEEKPPDRPENIEQSIVDYVKEAVLQVSQAADELTLVTNPTPDEEAIKRISNSEIDLLKEEFSRLHHEADDVVVVADVTTSSTTTTTRIQEEASGTSRKRPNNSATSFTSTQPRDTAFIETVTKSNAFCVTSSPPGNTDSPAASHPPSTIQSPASVVLRPLDATSRQYDRPPSYTSGTRSAQTSRAATPEVPDIPRTSVFAVPSRKSGLPEPPPSFVIPHHSSFQTHKQQPIPTLSDAPRYSSADKSPPKRPVIFMKSLSMDSGTILDNDLSEHFSSPQVTSISASNTPTQPVTTADLTSYFATPSVITSSGDHLLSSARNMAPRTSHSLPRTGKCSPRTARRKFFENYPDSASLLSDPIGYQSWPERRHVPPAIHTRQTSLPDPEEVRKEAEEEHDLVSSKLESKGKYSVMKSSTSWDEQMHRKEVAQTTNASSQEGTRTVPTQANLLAAPGEKQTGSRQASAKEKRKMFKKAMSLDSTVGSSIAKVGVAAMPLGAPTGFAPSELFATVKGKLKPVFKKKSANSGSKSHEPRSPSPLFIQTEVPDIHFAARGSTSLPVPAPPVDVTLLDHGNQTELDKSPSDIPDDRSRDSTRNDIPRGKWRSKSADRAQGAGGVHADVIRSSPGVWKFNETAV